MVNSIYRFTFLRWVLNLVVAGLEPMNIQITIGSINRYTIGQGGQLRKAIHTRFVGRSEGCLKSAISRLISGFSGRVGSSVVFRFFAKIKLHSRFPAISGRRKVESCIYSPSREKRVEVLLNGGWGCPRPKKITVQARQSQTGFSELNQQQIQRVNISAVVQGTSTTYFYARTRICIPGLFSLDFRSKPFFVRLLASHLCGVVH